MQPRLQGKRAVALLLGLSVATNLAQHSALVSSKSRVKELENAEPKLVWVYEKKPIELKRFVVREEVLPWTDRDIEDLTKAVWGEARGCSKLQQSAVVWCILNRVDSNEFPNTIDEVVYSPNQFQGYSYSNPVDSEIKRLVEDVLWRWYLERSKLAEGSVGRTLPKEYLYFIGDSKNNYFSKSYKSKDYWNWTLENPY